MKFLASATAVPAELSLTARYIEQSHPKRQRGRRLQNALSRNTSAARITAPVAGGIPGWLRLPTMVGSGARAHSMENARLGILPGYPLPLGMLPVLASHRDDSGDLPGSARLARDLWTLPTHSRLTERDLLALERWLSAARTD